MTAALGFGVSGPHGAAWFSERKLARLIAQAVDGGVRHFDTAAFYGEAEARLGRAARGSDVILSTKTGTRRLGRRVYKDFSEAGIRDDVEASLKRLDREAIDMLYLHGPSLAEIDAALPVLHALRREGKVRAFGVCGEGAALDHGVDLGFDAIMGAFNVLDRRHASVFARAQAKGVLTAAIAPIAQGALADKKLPVTPSDLWRQTRAAVRGGPPADAVRAARDVLAGASGMAPSAAALAFVMQSGLASFAVTTTTNPAHLAETLAAARQPLGESVMARLSALAFDPATLDPARGRS